MTNKLSECPYCKRPADNAGSIFHVGGCTALQEVPLNRLQYDGLTQEIERLRTELDVEKAAHIKTFSAYQWLAEQHAAQRLAAEPDAVPRSTDEILERHAQRDRDFPIPPLKSGASHE